MKVIRPVPFVNSMLVSSDAVEAHAAWSSATTYAVGNRVIYNESVYESLQASNINKQPDTSPTFWVRIGPSNRTAMFDNQVSTSTTRASGLSVTINPGQTINSLAFFNLTGDSVSVQMTDGAAGPVVYSKTVGLDDTPIVDWYGFFFEPYDKRSELVLTDLPPYPAGRVSVSVAGPSVSVGVLAFGTVYELGGTQANATAGVRDYSVKETDAFGVTTFVQRNFSKRMEAQVFVDNQRLNFLQRLLADLRATPAAWIGSEGSTYGPLTVFGYYRDFNIDISYPDYSFVRIEIEGLI